MCLARIWAKVKIPVSGLFSSWATPAANKPTDDSFSDRMICAWALFRSRRLAVDLFREFLRPALKLSLCRLELLGHLHEGTGQLSDFVGAGDRDGHVEVTLGHSLRALQQSLHRAIHESVNQQRPQSAHDARRNDAPGNCVARGARHALIRILERNADVDDTQQLLFLLVGVARGIPAGRLIVDHFNGCQGAISRAANHTPAIVGAFRALSTAAPNRDTGYSPPRCDPRPD